MVWSGLEWLKFVFRVVKLIFRVVKAIFRVVKNFSEWFGVVKKIQSGSDFFRQAAICLKIRTRCLNFSQEVSTPV